MNLCLSSITCCRDALLVREFPQNLACTLGMQGALPDLSRRSVGGVEQGQAICSFSQPSFLSWERTYCATHNVVFHHVAET